MKLNTWTNKKYTAFKYRSCSHEQLALEVSFPRKQNKIKNDAKILSHEVILISVKHTIFQKCRLLFDS